jgi:hypothetical protein
MRQRVLLTAFPLIVALMGSCSAAVGLGGGAYMHAVVELPDFPTGWAGADAWELSWVSAEDCGQPMTLPPGSRADLYLPRLHEAAILCSARFGSSRSLPYGAVWPLDREQDGSIRVSAAGGYAAALALVFYRASSLCCCFDLRRFAAESVARLPDPWDVDPASLAFIAAERRFSVDYLRQPEMVEVVIDGLVCAMSPDSPWGRAAIPDRSGQARVRIACGRIRRWYGGGYELAVGVSASGVASWTLACSGMLMKKVLPEPSMLLTEASPP